MIRLHINSKAIVLFILVGLIAPALRAQQNPYNEVSIASPTVASLAKYADIPVNYHTGIPQVGIPIYTIKEGPLELPISLSYHAGGLKVMEPASWVGAGWSLNAGGVITRTVEGAPDEKGTSNVDGQIKGHFSDHGYSSYLWDNDKMDWDNIAAGKKDGEPDMFFFNFGGYSGKFYFHDDRTPVLVPEQDIKIVPDGYNNVGSIPRFIVTTPDGIKYYFGTTVQSGDTDPTEKTEPFTTDGGLAAGKVISSWYLNKIESADGLFKIDLKYVAESYSYYTLSMFPVGYGNTSDTDPGNDFEYKLIKNFVTGVRLDKITFSTGSVTFVPEASARTDLSNQNREVAPEFVNTSAKALSSIDISNENGFCKRFKLSTSYFESSAVLRGYFATYNLFTDKKRLKLNSVQEISCDGGYAPAHVFEYYNETSVPRRLSFGQDYWGFYNGVTTNTGLIPQYTEDNFTVIPGANRSPSVSSMQNGTLKKITYPTGGYTQFAFEAHNTWVTKTEYNLVYAFSLSVASPGTPSQEWTQSLTANTYRLDMSNHVTGGAGMLEIKTLSGQPLGAYSVNAGESKTFFITLPVASYKFVLSKNPIIQTGQGVTAEFREQQGQSVSRNETVGGLRISKIENYDGMNPLITISYKYDDPVTTQSNGILFSRPVFVQKVRNEILKTIGWRDEPVCEPEGCIDCGGKGYYKSAAPIRPLETTQGNHIGYSEVRVSQTGNGYSKYTYNIPSNFLNDHSDIAVLNVNPVCSSNFPNYPAAPPPFDPNRGELKKEEVFKEDGTIVQSTEYSNIYESGRLVTPALKVAYSPVQELGRVANMGTFYKLTTAKKFSTTIKKSVYNASGQNVETVNTVYYESRFHNNPTRTVSNLSAADVVEEKITYAADFRIPGCDEPISGDCIAMFDDNSTCETQYLNATTACLGNHTCLWDAWQDYQHCLITKRNLYVNCRSDESVHTADCIEDAQEIASSKLKPILQLQGQFTNPPIETTSWINGKLRNAFYSNFSYASDPPTAIYPSKTETLPLTESIRTNFISAKTNPQGTSVSKDNNYEDESVLSFQKGNLSEITDKAGVTKSYTWGYKNQYPIAITVNASHADVIAYTSFEESWLDEQKWSYTGTHVLSGTTTPAPTGKYFYNLSTGIITISGLKTNMDYTVSYWYTATNPYNFTLATVKGYKIGKKVNGWTFIEIRIRPTASTVTIAGTGNIDELRLYPATARMTTYTYDPLVGISSQCDEVSRISYYEYDHLGRLRIVRDQDRFILNRYCYALSGERTLCDARKFFNMERSATFIKSGCDTAHVGSIENYKVYAGTYESDSSQELADQLAINDVSLHGQAYADSAGNCSELATININYINQIGEGAADFEIKFTNIATGQQRTLTLPTVPQANGTLGNIPTGNYNIAISKTNNNSPYSFYAGCGYALENVTNATFYNIAVRTTGCNTITFLVAE